MPRTQDHSHLAPADRPRLGPWPLRRLTHDASPPQASLSSPHTHFLPQHTHAHTHTPQAQAVIDFGEDEGIADEVAAGVLPDMRALRAELAGFLGGGQRGQLVRDGVRVALVGPPNAGKSSLLNALAGRDAAIVSPFPGTTRDVMELELELGGQRVGGLRGGGLAAECDHVSMWHVVAKVLRGMPHVPVQFPLSPPSTPQHPR